MALFLTNVRTGTQRRSVSPATGASEGGDLASFFLLSQWALAGERVGGRAGGSARSAAAAGGPSFSAFPLFCFSISSLGN